MVQPSRGRSRLSWAVQRGSSLCEIRWVPGKLTRRLDKFPRGLWPRWVLSFPKRRSIERSSGWPFCRSNQETTPVHTISLAGCDGVKRWYRWEHAVTISQTFQSDRELDVATPYNVLNFEVHEFRIKAQLLNDPGILPGGKARVIFWFGTGDHHFAGRKNQRSRLRISYPHDHGSETLRLNTCLEKGNYLRVVFGVPSMQSNGFQIKPTIKVDSSYDIPSTSLANRPYWRKETQKGTLTVAWAQCRTHPQ